MVILSARRGIPRASAWLALLAVPVLLMGCGSIQLSAPPASPTDFAGIVGRLAVAKVGVDAYTSGDAGCSDPDLVPAAISLHVQGLDQPAPLKLYLYVFRNADAFNRHRQQVGSCAQSYVTDASTFEEIEQSPYVLAGQGPWPTQLKAALRTVLAAAAGTGG